MPSPVKRGRPATAASPTKGKQFDIVNELQSQN
jgi:hypothetical protein